MMASQISLEPTSCPFCETDSCKFYRRGKDRFFGVPGEFQVVRCNGCQHIYMNPRPTAESIPDCYPSGYSPHRPAVTSQGSTPETDQPVHTPWYLSRWVRAIPGLRQFYYWLTDTRSVVIPDLPFEGARAIELGCAGGKFLDTLRGRGWQSQGVELMPEPAEEARQRGYDVRVGTLEEARFPDATFDAAFAFMVIEHLPDPMGTLREFHRVLKSDGWIVFSIPNAGSWEARLFGSYWSDLELPRHLQQFTVKSISQFLSKAGFTEVRIIHQRTVWGLIGSLGVALSEVFPGSRIGSTMKRWFCENPPLWAHLGTAALIKPVVAILGSGRITVVARKPLGQHGLDTLES